MQFGNLEINHKEKDAIHRVSTIYRVLCKLWAISIFSSVAWLPVFSALQLKLQVSVFVFALVFADSDYYSAY